MDWHEKYISIDGEDLNSKTVVHDHIHLGSVIVVKDGKAPPPPPLPQKVFSVLLDFGGGWTIHYPVRQDLFHYSTVLEYCSVSSNRMCDIANQRSALQLSAPRVCEPHSIEGAVVRALLVRCDPRGRRSVCARSSGQKSFISPNLPGSCADADNRHPELSIRARTSVSINE